MTKFWVVSKTIRLLVLAILISVPSFAGSFSPVKQTKARFFMECDKNKNFSISMLEAKSCHFASELHLLDIAATTDSVDLFNDTISDTSLTDIEKYAAGVILSAAAADSPFVLKAMLEEVLQINTLSGEAWDALVEGGINSGVVWEHPIFSAAQAGNIGIVTYFLSTGVKLSIVSTKGLTLDIVAMFSMQDEMIEYVRRIGLEVNCDVVSPNGKTIKEVAKNMGFERYYSNCEN